MVFEDINTGEVADLFINVDITIQRGELRGMDRDTGKGGQFLPPEGGKFRKFWMSVVGKEPYRWSRVHKELKSKLKRFIFTGDVEEHTDKKGNKYLKIKNLKLCNA